MVLFNTHMIFPYKYEMNNEKQKKIWYVRELIKYDLRVGLTRHSFFFFVNALKLKLCSKIVKIIIVRFVTYL